MNRRLAPVLVFLLLSPLSALLPDCGGDDSANADAGTDAPAPDTSSSGGRDASGDATGEDSGDAATDAGGDSAAADAGRYCDYGVTVTAPTSGAVVLFDGEDGGTLPAGHYRITYRDGCMTYAAGQPWTVHAYQPQTDAAAYAVWTLVTTDGGLEPVALPGYWIFGPGATGVDAGQGYDTCVAYNQTATPAEFDYDAGAPLGVQSTDSPLDDNVGSPDGGNGPVWRLERLSPSGACP